MVYEKKVKYLDYFEGGMRVRGGGFVKLEMRDGTLRIELALTGLHHTDTFARDVMLCGRDREESCGKIEICAGRGQYRQQWRNLENIGGTGIGYGELCGIHIPLGGGRQVSGRWQEKEEENSRHESILAEPEKMEPKEIRVEAFEEEKIREEAEAVSAGEGGEGSGGELQGSSMETATDIETWMQEETEDMIGGRKRHGGEMYREAGRHQATDGMEDDSARGKRLRDLEAGTAGQENVRLMKREDRHERTDMTGENQDNGHSRPEAVKGDGSRVEWKADSARQRKHSGESAKTAPVKLMEDKWSQLWAIYPHIRPFQDAREYLSIGPADFVLFPEAFYKAANNSFLLHGYYNYHHLLLARVERRGESVYYIGVPGNFYEREKQVAIMFGFESFECAEEPAQAGDFGYYMMRAQI